MQKIFRGLILFAMLIVAYLLILAWQEDYSGVAQQNTSTASITAAQSTKSDVPNATVSDLPQAASTNVQPAAASTKATSGLIEVTTDVYNIKIDPVGGDVVYAALKDYDATLDSDSAFVLLQNNAEHTYVAQSGLIGTNGVDTAQGRAKYSYQSDRYVMQDDQNSLVVPLSIKKDGVTISKTYTFLRDSYPIEMSYSVDNSSNNVWNGQVFTQLKRDDSKDPGMTDKGALSMATYLGGAWGTPDDDYNKLKFDDYNDKELSLSSDEGWVGVVQHYFVSAWTPINFTGQFFSKEADGDYIIGMVSAPISVAPNSQQSIGATLYAGPKVQSLLHDISPGLDKSVDYGILWPISKLLFTVLEGIHNVIGNWGWSIIVLTILVKIALMWFSNKSYYSMAKMRALAPRMQALKEEHGDDRMKMSQEMMAMYREEQVNPMAGCLPILLQMPIFLALYWVLVESVELRHAPWVLWIQDLSSMDPLFILPIFMGITMFAQQTLSPQPADPMQAKVMRFLPIIFTVFMLFFPAGLVLYWTVNNLFTMAQQYIVNHKVEQEQKAKTVKVLS